MIEINKIVAEFQQLLIGYLSSVSYPQCVLDMSIYVIEAFQLIQEHFPVVAHILLREARRFNPFDGAFKSLDQLSSFGCSS